MKAKTQWGFAARGEGTGTLDLDIYDVIGDSWWGDSVSAKQVRTLLKSNPSAKQINVRINSAGGDVVDGFAIYQMLAEHPAKVTVDVDSLAASMASVIAMAGATRRMAQNAMMMIHNPWGASMGESSDLRAHADVLDKMRANMVNTYAQRTGQKAEKIGQLMDAETWLTAEEAKGLGFCDSITPGKKMAASLRFELGAFKNVPKDFAASIEQNREVEGQLPSAIDGEGGGDVDPTAPIDIAASQVSVAGPVDDSISTAAVSDTVADPGAAASIQANDGAPGAAVNQPTRQPAPQKDKTMSDTIVTIRALVGLSAGAPDTDVIAAVTRHRDLEREVMSLTAATSTEQAVGALRAQKVKADNADGMSVELSKIRGERDQQNFDALILRGQSEPVKLTPALATLYRDEFKAAQDSGKGADVVERLRGFIAAAPAVIIPRAERPRQPAPAASLNGEAPQYKWNDKTYAELTYAQRASLARENEDLFRTMKSAWEAAQAA